MSQNEESVSMWLERLKAGHSSAANRLWQRYIEQLVCFARRKLNGVPCRVADEEDVALAAFDAFLRGVKEGRFARLDDRDDLWQVLVTLTERKAIGLRRREGALKRGGGRVRGNSVFASNDNHSSQHNGLDQIADPEPSPAFAAEMAEQTRGLLACLDPALQRIALGKLEGYTNAELAVELGIAVRSVERKLKIIRNQWDTLV